MVWVVLLIAGLCLGSFVNALVWRLHEQESGTKKKKRDLSITKGRSMCPHCSHTLAGKDLIPVFSWLWLRGKCRYCRKPIGWQYPLVELAVALLAVISYLAWPYVGDSWTGVDSVAFGLWLLLLTGFMALAVYDLKWYLLPNRIVGPLTVLGAVFVITLAYTQDKPADILLGGVVGAALIAGLFYALFQISKGKWIGGGDVKLAALLGLLAGGVAEALLLLFLASLFGTVYSIVLGLVQKRRITRTTRIPFGPFLISATIIVFLWGQTLIDGYTDFLMGL